MKGLLDLDFWRVLQMQDCQNVLSASRHKLITLTTHASAVVWLECRSRFLERKTFLEKTCFFFRKKERGYKNGMSKWGGQTILRRKIMDLELRIFNFSWYILLWYRLSYPM